MKPEHIKDANRRRPSDPDYDPTTIYIPPQEWHKFSPTMN